MLRAQINVTPLIDVLLVLLITFMVVTPITPGSLNVRVPAEQKDARVGPHPDTILITIDRDKSISLNRENIASTIDDLQPLAERLRTIFSQRDANANPARTVFIKAPEQLEYGQIATVIDAAKGAGAAPVALQVDGLER